MTTCRLDLEDPHAGLLRVLARPGIPLAEVIRTAQPHLPPESHERHAQAETVDPTHRVGHPPLLDGAVVRLGPPAPPAALEVRVEAGPSTGRRAPLGGVGVVIGREPECDLVLDDPAASRRHARVDLVDGVARVSDLSTTNGTCVEELALRVASSRLVVGPAPRTQTGAAVSTDGTVRHRADTTRHPQPGAILLDRPTPPREEDLHTIDPVTLLAPLGVSALVALVLHSPVLLLLGLAGPLLAVVAAVRDRRRGRRRRGSALAEHERVTAQWDARLAESLAAEADERRARAVDTARALDLARCRSPRLWSGGTMRWTPGRGSCDAERVHVRDEDPQQLTDVPVTVELARGDVVRLDGAHARGAAYALVAQLTATHAPSALAVAVVADPRTRRQWRWADLLPHRRPELDDLPLPDGKGITLVVVDGSSAPEPTSGTIVVVLGAAAPPADRLHTLDTDAGAVVGPDGRRTECIPDLLAPDAADDHARRLCPLRDGTATAGSTPASAALADLLEVGTDLRDPRPVVDRWADHPRLGPVPLGIGPDGPVLVDLTTDGPHALVAGTTGAGKSELLTTLVLALALTHSPEVLSVLVVDFKGGATGAALADLPHVCDIVTDLDPLGANRALTGLEAELKRRERLVAQAGVRHVDDTTGIPRLLIVVDEYRVLAEEHPAFLAGLLRVATTGRSLGVHLVLATQRPAGIVSADVRANVSLRIALRLNDAHDSSDVIEGPEAASIPPSLPGRAMLRRADGALEEVQVAMASAPPSRDRPAVVVPGRPGAHATCPPVLDDLVAAVQAATEHLDLTPAPSPVPPALPGLLDDTDLPADALGLVDLPHEQRQDLLRHDPTIDGHLAVVGTARSGRTTLLRRMVANALRAPDGPAVHVIGGPELTASMTSGRLGSVVDPGHTRLVLRLLETLRTPSSPTLLVVDGWRGGAAGTDPVTALRLQDALVRILTEGPGRGLHVAMSGDRSLLSGSLAGHLPYRLVLRLADTTDLALVGLSPSLGAAWTRPGRGIRAADGATVHLALPPATLDVPGPLAVIPRLRPLPQDLTLTSAMAADGVIGVGGDEARPVRLDVGDHRSVLVCGPEGSGRTTAVGALAVASRRPVVRVDRSTDPTVLDVALAASPSAVVVVDDLSDIADGPLDAALVAVVEQQRHPVVVGARTTDVEGAYRGLAGLVRRNRTGIVLGPRGPVDGEVLGVRLDTVDDPTPGRGVLVASGRQVVVQIARPASAPGGTMVAC